LPTVLATPISKTVPVSSALEKYYQRAPVERFAAVARRTARVEQHVWRCAVDANRIETFSESLRQQWVLHQLGTESHPFQLPVPNQRHALAHYCRHGFHLAGAGFENLSQVILRSPAVPNESPNQEEAQRSASEGKETMAQSRRWYVRAEFHLRR
jgi:hypothetical protein